MDTENIDSNGFRENVGIILFNSEINFYLQAELEKRAGNFLKAAFIFLKVQRRLCIASSTRRLVLKRATSL